MTVAVFVVRPPVLVIAAAVNDVVEREVDCTSEVTNTAFAVSDCVMLADCDCSSVVTETVPATIPDDAVSEAVSAITDVSVAVCSVPVTVA